MSQQQEQQPEKWKGMFGRLKNCRGNRKRLSVRALSELSPKAQRARKSENSFAERTF